MSKKTDAFEQSIASFISHQSALPASLPQWLLDLGVQPNARIRSAKRVGSKNAKTDIFVMFTTGEPLKISAKLANADYFGNWYSHKRIIAEFGEDAFHRLVTDCTQWANEWKHTKNASIFVGVSICFGKRSGLTAREFTDIFTYEDIIKIVAGVGNSDDVANCLYQGSQLPETMEQLLTYLQPINEETVLALSKNFKVAYRPINPMTEDSNRGKCSYAKFQPYKQLAEQTTVTTLEQLNTLGEYVEVQYDSTNHNHVLRELEAEYNIVIPKKVKTKKTT
ncbi:MAG: hypothetical protein UHX00_07940 [Caryophanon sp.]|nr:hypothetical protein [Caryophanon sp.]